MRESDELGDKPQLQLLMHIPAAMMRLYSQDEVIPGVELTQWESRLDRNRIEWKCINGPLVEHEDIRSRGQSLLHRGVGCRGGSW